MAGVAGAGVPLESVPRIPVVGDYRPVEINDWKTVVRGQCLSVALSD